MKGGSLFSRGFVAVAGGGFLDVEADLRSWWVGWRVEERLEFLPDHAQDVVVLEELGVHLGEFFQDFCLPSQEFTLLDECPDDMDTHLYGLRAVEDIGSHERPVLGEGVREVFRKLQPGKVVTICDHLLLFLVGQLQDEILREPLRVAFDRLVQGLGRHAVNRGQVGVEENLLAADRKNQGVKETGRLHAIRVGPITYNPLLSMVGFVLCRLFGLGAMAGRDSGRLHAEMLVGRFVSIGGPVGKGGKKLKAEKLKR
jgi:hypothetical protein